MLVYNRFKMKIFSFWLLIFLSVSTSAANLKTLKKESYQRIVILGDSIAAGDGVDKESSYPAQLELQLRARGHQVSVVNAGISGSTSASAVSRLKWQMRKKIDVLLIELGGNDGLRGVSVEATKKNLSETILLAKKEGIKVLLAGMELPVNYGNDYRKRFTALFAELANQYKVAFMPFLLVNVGGKRDLNLSDGIHPNEKGHRKIAENLIPFIERLL